MNHFFTSSSLLFLFLFLFTTTDHRSSTTAQELISKTCKACAQQDRNVKYAFCTSSLQAAPASRCAGLTGLGGISIRLTRYNVTDTRCFVKHLLKNNTRLNPYVKACLKDCFELYSDAINSVKLAMKSYRAKKYLGANIQITAVMDAATTCEDGFREKKGIVSPLTGRNNATFQLSAMVLSIMHFLQNGSSSGLN